MYCKKCGKEISDDSVFCKYCGTTQGEGVQTEKLQRISPQDSELLEKTKKVLLEKKSLKVLGVGIIVAIILISFIVKSWGDNKIGGIWAYDITAKENKGNLGITYEWMPADEHTLIYFHSDNSIEYYTSHVHGTLDHYSLVDGRLKWELPLGTTFYYDYEVSSNKLVLKDEHGKVGVFKKFDTTDEAFEYLEKNASEVIDKDNSKTLDEEESAEEASIEEAPVNENNTVELDEQEGQDATITPEWADDMVVDLSADPQFEEEIRSIVKIETGDLTYGDVKNLNITYNTPKDIDNRIDVSFLQFFPKLKEIDIDVEKAENLEILQQLQNIECVELTNADKDTLEFINKSSSPSYIRVRRYTGDSIEPIEGNENLEKLEIVSSAPKTDFQAIAQLPNLEYVVLGYELDNDAFLLSKDLEMLRNCKNLAVLYLFNYGDDNVNLVGELTNLRGLNIYLKGNPSKSIDLSPIGNLSNLESLRIEERSGYVDISIVDVISELKDLKELVLNSHDEGFDISCLKEYLLKYGEKLERLDLLWQDEGVIYLYNSDNKKLVIDYTNDKKEYMKDMSVIDFAEWI